MLLLKFVKTSFYWTFFIFELHYNFLTYVTKKKIIHTIKIQKLPSFDNSNYENEFVRTPTDHDISSSTILYHKCHSITVKHVFR